MVNLIEPDLLGTPKEFEDRFVGPITNGRFADSSRHAIEFMKKRVFILNKCLEQYVHLAVHSVCRAFLEPKHEYIIYIQLTDVQVALYKVYL